MPQVEWNHETMRYALCFFPLVGCVIGLLEWGWSMLSGHMGLGMMFTAAIRVAIPVLVTGGIHLDGLLDTADALSSHQEKEKKLEILKDSHAGAFAIIVCCVYFAVLFGAWSETDLKSVFVLGVGFALSRALSGFGVTAIPAARGSGLSYTFRKQADRKRSRRILIAEIVICMAAMILIDPLRGGCCAAVAAVVCLICYRMAMRQFGGTTGDIQGFFLCLCELLMVCAAALIPH